jgi:tRNA-splicing ligase RtcB (3'-phosphate/5'-hydroxy nucleic acid ligase)
MDIKIFAKNVEETAVTQINGLKKHPMFLNSKIRIMPDCHAGAGCVIGFTATFDNKVVPNLIGVDIGCNIDAVNIGNKRIDFDIFDRRIRKLVPLGMNVSDNIDVNLKEKFIDTLVCKEMLKNTDHLVRSAGTLGAGNHFIEVDTDDEGNKYLVIHTGSRNLGKQVAEIYQKIAINMTRKSKVDRNEIIHRLLSEERKNEIQSVLGNIKNDSNTSISNDMCWLEGSAMNDYLHDMKICQEFALYNHKMIQKAILHDILNIEPVAIITSVHNYINFDDMIMRKGAISAHKGESVVIPMNMRDGTIIGVGKGNQDWNCSAPHGAGRLMSRTKAKELLSIDEYKKSMNGISTTSVSEKTIDEAPMAYKPMQEIIDAIRDTVDIKKIIKPVYNLKAEE